MSLFRKESGTGVGKGDGYGDGYGKSQMGYGLNGGFGYGGCSNVFNGEGLSGGYGEPAKPFLVYGPNTGFGAGSNTGFGAAFDTSHGYGVRGGYGEGSQLGDGTGTTDKSLQPRILGPDKHKTKSCSRSPAGP